MFHIFTTVPQEIITTIIITKGKLFRTFDMSVLVPINLLSREGLLEVRSDASVFNWSDCEFVSERRIF
jgi:hypothetical protein